MPSVHKPIRKGSIYANELLTEKPLTDTEPELHPDNHVVKAKSPKPVARTPTARHRNALKPGKINDKSDDTLHDAPSIQKVGGPSYEDVSDLLIFKIKNKNSYRQLLSTKKKKMSIRNESTKE